MIKRAWHRLRRNGEVIGASGSVEWGFVEPEQGKPLPPLECFFPVEHKERMYGKLEVWLFRVDVEPELFREEKIGEITITRDIPYSEEWVNDRRHLIMKVFLDGHKPE